MPLSSSHTYLASGVGIRIARTETGNEAAYYDFNDFAGTGVVRDVSFTSVTPNPDLTNALLYNVPNGIDANSTGWTRDYPSKVYYNKNVSRFSLKLNTTPIGNQYIQLPNSPVSSIYDILGDPIGDFSFSCWLKTNKIGQVLLQGATVSSPFGIGIRLINLAIQLFIEGNAYSISVPNISNGTWNHFVVKRSGSNWSVAVNGTIYNGTAVSTSVSLLPNSFLIGQRYNAFSGSPTFDVNEQFSGTITEIRFYRYALSTPQIQALASGNDLATYNNSLFSNSYVYNVDASSISSGSFGNVKFKLPYTAEGGISVSGDSLAKKAFKFIGGLNSSLSIGGSTTINRITYKYIPKRTFVGGSVLIYGSSTLKGSWVYNGNGTVFTVDPLVPEFSRAKVRRGQAIVGTGSVDVYGDAIKNLKPIIKLDIRWQTSITQILRRKFVWDSGKSRLFFYRVVSKCVDKCPPFDKMDEDCNIRITTIIPAVSIDDLCAKLKKQLKFPILFVQKLSRPAETSALQEDAALGITHDCTTFEPVEVCSNPLCAEFCLSLDDITFGGITTSLSLISYYKYTGSKNQVFLSGSAVSTYYHDPLPPDVFYWYVEPILNIVNVSGTALVNTTGYSANNFLNYVSAGEVSISGSSTIISQHYNFTGGIDSYYTDLWPSQSTEIIDNPLTYSYWRYKKPLSDFPSFEAIQQAPSQFFMVDQRANTNPTDGYYPRTYVGTTPLATKPPSTYLVLNHFRGIGYFPPTQDSYLSNPAGGDTFGTYASEDINRLGRIDFFHEDFDTDYDIASITFFMRRTSAESSVKDKEVYLALNNNFVSKNIANTSLLWPVSSAPSTLNFSVYKYKFGEEKVNPFNPDDYSIDVKNNLTNENLGFVLRVEPNSAVSQCYGVVHYVFMRVLYQHKEHQVIRIGGSAKIRSTRYSAVMSGGCQLEGKALIRNSRKVKGKGLISAQGSYIYNFSMVASGGVSLGGTPTLANGKLISSAFYYLGDQTSSVLSGQAVVKSTSSSWTMSGSVELNSNTIIQRKKYRYIAKSPVIVIGGTIQNSWSVEAAGSVSIGGVANTISSGYGYKGQSGALVSGTALVISSFLGEFLSIIGGISDIVETTIFDLVESTAPVFEPPTLTLTRCNCSQLPLVLRYSQNVNRENKFAQFLAKNNLSMPNKSTMSFNSINDSWQENFHFVGKSLIYDNIMETWDVVFELSCTNVIGAVFLGSNFWKFSMNIVQRNSIEDFNSRIIVAFPPDDSCFVNDELNFKISIDTEMNFAEIDPSISISQLVIYDEIGLFKSKSWISDPIFAVRISQGRLDRTVTRRNLDSLLV